MRLKTATSVILGIAGVAQIAAAFTPAAHVRTRGSIAFIRLPSNVGVALLVLGALTVLIAFTRRGWWRSFIPLASIALTAIVYARIRTEPSGGFADPLLRHLVRPAWGFVPMFVAAVLGLFATLASAATGRVKVDADAGV